MTILGALQGGYAVFIGSIPVHNLDAMGEASLRDFAWRLEREAVSEDMTSTRDALVSYARCKANAMVHRTVGHIVIAQAIESHCDRIYDSLPASVQW